MPNINLIHLKTKKLLRYYCSFHGNLVTVAMKHVSRKLDAKYELYMILTKGITIAVMVIWFPQQQGMWLVMPVSYKDTQCQI